MHSLLLWKLLNSRWLLINCVLFVGHDRTCFTFFHPKKYLWPVDMHPLSGIFSDCKLYNYILGHEKKNEILGIACMSNTKTCQEVRLAKNHGETVKL